jgi:glycosyltransferase involved in cell wall biosynthesis
MLSFADRIALISKTQERELKLPVNVPRSYIRNFLPSSILSAEPVSRQISAIPKLQLLHAARLSEGKGTFLFVDVCAQLRELNVPFAARIVGGADGDTIGRLKQKIKDLGLSESVIVLGRVSDDDLFQHLKNSDALVHLSKIDSYPLIVLESILSCTIPVCMDLPGARDMAGTYAGHIVSEVTAVEETARFLARHSSEDLASLTRDAAARVRIDYSWDSCVSMLEAALLAVAAQRPGPASSPSEG